VPRSIIWHRSEQKGRKRFRCDISAGFLQMGHGIGGTDLKIADEGAVRNVVRSGASGIRVGVYDLTPNPFPWWEEEPEQHRNLTPDPFPQGKGTGR